jgi:hypothetical protein
MTTRETRIRIDTLSVEAARFDEALFRRSLAEQIGGAKERREDAELAVARAARAASQGEPR